MAGRSQVSPLTVWIVGLNVLAVLVLWQALEKLQPILMLIVLALFLALALDVPVRWLEQRGLRRGGGILVVALGLCALFVLTVRSLIPILTDQIGMLVHAVPQLVEKLSESEWLGRVDERFGLRGTVIRALNQLPGKLTGWLLGALSSTVILLVGSFTVFVLVLFMLLFGGPLTGQALSMLEPKLRDRVRLLLGRMREAVSGYLAGAIIQVAIGAGVTAISTWLLGVPYFLALGLGYFVLGFIPYVGSAVMALLVSLATLASVDFKRALIALGIFLVYQQVESNLLQPFIQRHTIRMNPLLITLVVLIGAGVWGVLGAVVSIPFAAAIQVGLRELQNRKQAERTREESAAAGDEAEVRA